MELEYGELLRDIAQHLAALYAAEFRLRVRVVLADIAEARRAKQRIADRVQQDIGVRVTVEAPLVGDLHAADHQPAAAYQRVHVEALPDPHLRPARMAAAIATSSS